MEPASKAGPAAVEAQTMPWRLPMAISPLVPRSTSAVRSALLRDARGDDACKDVGADEAAEATSETDHAIGRQVPTEIARGEALLGEMRRLEGYMRERLDVETAKQMVHNGVADEENFGDLRCAAAGEARDELAERGADGRGEVLAFERGADAAHDVGTEGGLGIERGFDG